MPAPSLLSSLVRTLVIGALIAGSHAQASEPKAAPADDAKSAKSAKTAAAPEEGKSAKGAQFWRASRNTQAGQIGLNPPPATEDQTGQGGQARRGCALRIRQGRRAPCRADGGRQTRGPRREDRREASQGQVRGGRIPGIAGHSRQVAGTRWRIGSWGVRATLGARALGAAARTAFAGAGSLAARSVACRGGGPWRLCRERPRR
jgi:hypothetical protein